MPETKVLAGLLVGLISNIALAATDNPAFLDFLPDHWEGPAATIAGFIVAYYIRNRHLAPSTLTTAEGILR